MKAKKKSAIDRLIPIAEKTANLRVKKEDYSEATHGEDWKKVWGHEWNVVFHDEMDRMAAEAGLRSTRKYKKAA